MGDSAVDPVAQAAIRLERAVDRLADVLPAALARAGAGQPGEMVARREVAALADRLEGAIARLRGALDDGQDGDEPDAGEA